MNIVIILAHLTANLSGPVVQVYFRKRIWQKSSDKDMEIVKILAPLTENPNAPYIFGQTPVNQAACNGHTEIVKFLAPLADNPNAPAENGETPIYVAASKGHTEIVKYLASLNLRN